MNDVNKKKLFPLSKKVELPVVLTLAFGFFIFTTVRSLIYSFRSGYFTYSSSNLGIVKFILIPEILIGTILLVFLLLQRFPFKKEHFSLDKKSIKHTVLLFLSYLFVASILRRVFIYFLLHKFYKVAPASLNIYIVLAILVLNSLFEEFFLIEYLFQSLSDKISGNKIVLISVALRLSYHLYQGPLALTHVLPVGFLFGFYYLKYRKLFPLVITHGLWNLFVFAPQLDFFRDIMAE